MHGTTHEIPMERLKKEILNKTSSVKPYVSRNKESRKVSRECYVSYKGNRYSVPWKYAGRECNVVEESSMLRIEVDSNAVAEHTILSGTGRISRNKDHFIGLLKAIREENTIVYTQLVEKRDLKSYDEVS